MYCTQKKMATSWSSVEFEGAVQTRSIQHIVIQASAFSLFLIMSDAWTAFFQAVVDKAININNEDRDVWLSLARAVSSTIFCIFLMAVIIVTARLKVSRSEKSLMLFGKKIVWGTSKENRAIQQGEDAVSCKNRG
jgi:hypothetical protein